MTHPEIANGNTNSEYATAILELCGVDEKWWNERTSPTSSIWHHAIVQRWFRKVPKDLREQLEELVQLIKDRAVQNVLHRQKGESAVGDVQKFIEGKNHEAFKRVFGDGPASHPSNGA